jgi:hypothetical protein
MKPVARGKSLAGHLPNTLYISHMYLTNPKFSDESPEKSNKTLMHVGFFSFG